MMHFLLQVVNDLSMEEDIIAVADRPEFLDKIQKRVETIEIKEINAPREGKKLLVLDIDYTLFGRYTITCILLYDTLLSFHFSYLFTDCAL